MQFDTNISIPMLTSYEPIQAVYYHNLFESGFTEYRQVSWAYLDRLNETENVIARDRGLETGKYEAVVMRTDTYVSTLRVSDGKIGINVGAIDRDTADRLIRDYQEKYPRIFFEDDKSIAVRFWTAGANAPMDITRKLEVPRWGEIATNYSTEIRSQIDSIIDDPSQLQGNGKFILWHGEPGTGKTYAIRALLNEFKPWATPEYIIDPHNFFIGSASYMLNVIMGKSTYTGEDLTKGERWRFLIFEDTGELLAANAKDQMGQGLSRFLNLADGLIGQGLRTLMLITTNDNIKDMHPAVVRPGRCAQLLKFGVLDVPAVKEWADEHGIEAPAKSQTLAQLYALTQGRESEPIKKKATMGFRPILPTGTPITVERTSGSPTFVEAKADTGWKETSRDNCAICRATDAKKRLEVNA